jgi:hypothetical protein
MTAGAVSGEIDPVLIDVIFLSVVKEVIHRSEEILDDDIDPVSRRRADRSSKRRHIPYPRNH